MDVATNDVSERSAGTRLQSSQVERAFDFYPRGEPKQHPNPGGAPNSCPRETAAVCY